VTEPLKVSRLLLGVDDTALESVKIIPRLPPDWTSVVASNWPIRSTHGVVRAEISYEKKGTGAVLTLKLPKGERIDDLKVRMPSKNGYVWREQKHASEAKFVTQ